MNKRYWANFGEQIEQEASKGNQNALYDTINSAIFATGRRFHHPLLLDYEIHGFWHIIITAAKSFTWDNPRQNQLVYQVLYVREIGIVTSNIEGKDAGLILRTSNGQKIWSDLPFLQSDLERACTDISMSLTQNLNLHSFIARLASAGACGDLLTGCALRLFKDALETRHTSLIKKLLPAIRMWVLHAPHKMSAVVENKFRKGNEFSPELATVGHLCHKAGIEAGGFSPVRWAFWKKLLLVMKGSNQEEISDEASSILVMMDMIDEDNILV